MERFDKPNGDGTTTSPGWYGKVINLKMVKDMEREQ